MIPHAQAASAVPHRLGGGPNLLICPASSPSRASYSEDFSAMDALARLGLSIVLCAVPVAAAEPLEIGSRWELFVDEFLVAEKNGVALKLDEPVRREVVLVTDRPWEGIPGAARVLGLVWTAVETRREGSGHRPPRAAADGTDAGTDRAEPGKGHRRRLGDGDKRPGHHIDR